jgi:hypothetical protein
LQVVSDALHLLELALARDLVPLLAVKKHAALEVYLSVLLERLEVLRHEPYNLS